MAKPRVAVFDFTGCEGCELQILNCEDEILDVLGHIEIVNFREAMDGRSDDYDIALVEGGISTEADIERITGIRERAGLLITIGSCSSTGGINCLKNSRSMDENRRLVYGDDAKYVETIPARPVGAVVKVDLSIPGCPIDKKEFLRCLTELLVGKTPAIPNYAVCVDCKLRENECRLQKGVACLGPVTRAGCEARCPSNAAACEGCRGLVDDPNLNAARDVLEKHGLTVDDVIGKFRLFQGHYEELEAVRAADATGGE